MWRYTMLIEVSRGLPIAETFLSLQGEGTYVGTPMHFIRLAGCPVGFKATEEAVTALKPGNHEVIPVLESGRRGSLCKTWDGRRFTCDTDFSCHTYKTVDELIGETWEKHICLTGGEPLIHQQNLISSGFFQQAFQKGIQIHIETSGTVDLAIYLRYDRRIWITVSPKWNCLDRMMMLANEVKFLVDEEWDEEKVAVMLHPGIKNVYISPINNEKTVNQENVQRALKILGNHPEWRLSCQWHKFLNLR
jgi:organic radical activating enzyme